MAWPLYVCCHCRTLQSKGSHPHSHFRDLLHGFISAMQVETTDEVKIGLASYEVSNLPNVTNTPRSEQRNEQENRNKSGMCNQALKSKPGAKVKSAGLYAGAETLSKLQERLKTYAETGIPTATHW
eukprot:6487471-Amphidinium_carterae.3